MKRLLDYSDCDVFKPGERWLSPRMSYYYVLSNSVGGRATLRRLEGRYGQPGLSGALRYVPWDGVMGWVRVAAAQESTP